jgi:Ca2+-binding EF-hand superfamily protein
VVAIEPRTEETIMTDRTTYPRTILLAAALAALVAACASEPAVQDNASAVTASDRRAVHEQHEKAIFDQADTDKNGKLSRAELEVAPAPAPMLALHFAEIDADGDGDLTHGEIATAIERHHGSDPAGHAQHGKEMFDRADTDKNGKLSRAEVEAIGGHGEMLAAQFDEIDADGDGALTHDEIVATMQRRHGGEAAH